MFAITKVCSIVPINSLRFKCLSKLASMMSQMTVASNVISTSPGAKKTKTSSSDRNSEAKSFHLPIDVTQLIVDHITQEQIPIRAECLCYLLSSGGCYTFDLERLCGIERFSDEEIEEILKTLARNCNHLRRFDGWCRVSPFSNGNNLAELKFLKCSVDQPEELIDIFSACPNLSVLKILNISGKNSMRRWDKDQIDNIVTKLKQVTNSQLQYSLRELDLAFCGIPKYVLIKLISKLTNLTKLSCRMSDCMFLYNAIGRAMDGEYTNESFYLSPTELETTSIIFSRIQGLHVHDTIKTNFIDKITSLFPNIQELSIHLYEPGNLTVIGNLIHLKWLSIATYNGSLLLEPVLKRIGSNLNYLSLSSSDTINVYTIARYCPKLKHLLLRYQIHVSFEQSALYASKEEKENMKRPFKHLQTLAIEQFFAPENHVVPYILKNAVNIKHIELYNCQLTEDQFNEIMKNNLLTNLRVLIINDWVDKNFLVKLINSLDECYYTKITI